MKFKRGELVEVRHRIGGGGFGVCVVVKLPALSLDPTDVSRPLSRDEYAYHLWSTRKNRTILIYEQHINHVGTQKAQSDV